MPFGVYFPGFTFSLALTGLIYGLILYKDPNKERGNMNFIIRLIISNAAITGLIKTLLDSLWLNILYGKAFIVLVTSRVTTQLILFPIYIIITFALMKSIDPIVKKYLYSERKV